MAVGFPARYSELVEHDFPREDLREAIIYTLDSLGWSFKEKDGHYFKARTSLTGSSWGETISIYYAEPYVLEVTSLNSWPPQIFDWGKNRKNVEAFVGTFRAKASRDAKLSPFARVNFDSDGDTPLERALRDAVINRSDGPTNKKTD